MSHTEKIVIILFFLWLLIIVGFEIYHKGYDRGHDAALESISRHPCAVIEYGLNEPPTTDSLN